MKVPSEIISSPTSSHGDHIMRSVIGSLSKLRLEQIPKDWATRIWDSEFTENPSLRDASNDEQDYGAVLDQIDIGHQLSMATEASKRWLEFNAKESEDTSANSTMRAHAEANLGFWNALNEEHIK